MQLTSKQCTAPITRVVSKAEDGGSSGLRLRGNTNSYRQTTGTAPSSGTKCLECSTYYFHLLLLGIPSSSTPTPPTPALTRESSLKLACCPSIIHDGLKASLPRKELKDLMIDVSVPSAVLVDDDAWMVKEIHPIPAAKLGLKEEVKAMT
ncbi:hypothetical protein BDD12DRAFT_810807 [Trichophaea hybrida]|nr:hypothetical protein BDD12DRAFT_810807 [Trichophaea hybrida]